MKVLFIRPPRYMWPMNSESSSFWQPIGFASMASVLRENGFDVEILDCLPLRVGWKSLEKEIRDRKPDVVCVGDETASYYESVKAVKLAKEIESNILTVAGGYHFGNAVEDSFSHCPVDYIVIGEGEYTLLDLLKNLKKPGKVKGIAYKKDGVIKINPRRELIEDLDELPLPAYDLLPMEIYGTDSHNHRDFAAIEHGRGCSGGCSFCSIWHQMSIDGKPRYRTKSAKKSIEETLLLVRKYGRKTLNWTDGTFNLDPRWSYDYFDLLELNKIKVKHTAWMRADCIVRDEKLGILEKMVRNGLVQAVVGMERFDNKSMNKLEKKNNTVEINRKAFRILRKYRTVYTIATVIYGMPDDRWRDLRNINKLIHSRFADIIFMLPFTPYPGTKLWNLYTERENDLRKYNLHLPVMATKHLTRKQLDWWFKFSLIDYVLLRPGNFLRRVLFEKDRRKRNVQLSLAWKIFKLGTQFLWNRATFKKGYELEYGIKPNWYDT